MKKPGCIVKYTYKNQNKALNLKLFLLTDSNIGF